MTSRITRRVSIISDHIDLLITKYLLYSYIVSEYPRLLGAFTKQLLRATISLAMSVRLSSQNNSATLIGWTFGLIFRIFTKISRPVAIFG
jgi:hypothetical protein